MARGKVIPKEVKEEALGLLAGGMSAGEVAAKLGVKTQLVYRWRSSERNSQHVNGTARITGALSIISEEIENLVKQNHQLRSIADRYEKARQAFART